MSNSGNLLDEITAANRHFMSCFQRGDAAELAACYTDDAQFLAPHMEAIKGRVAIEGVFQASAGQGRTLLLETLELEHHDDSAIEIGRYTRRDGIGATLDRGKYIVIWKQVDGKWRLHRDMVCTSLPKQA